MLAFIISSTLLAGAPLNIEPAAEKHLQAYFDAWAQVKTLTFRFRKLERMRDGEVRKAENFVKLRKPDQLYLLALEPEKGREAIYDRRRDAVEMTVHKGSFPDITLDIDVHGGLATKGEHHVILHISFSYTIGLMKDGLAKAYADPQGEELVYLGEQKVNGRAVEVIELRTEKRPARQVTAKKKETLFEFAERVKMDAYVIYCANPQIDDVTDKLKAKPYTVPGQYGARTQLFLDKVTHLPVRQITWNLAGEIYEQYDYIDMRVNPRLGALAFDPKNPEYDF